MYGLTEAEEDALLLRFLRLVSIDNRGCWIWKLSPNSAGYGRIGFNRTRHRVHRVAYELFKGPIPSGLQIDHLCRVRGCCNPAHLEAVTLQENVRRGEGPSAKAAATEACPRGHPYDQVNTYRNAQGHRYCRACHADRERQRRRRRQLERTK